MDRELSIYKNAEKDDNGDYIQDKGGNDFNVSRLFRPGKRTTSSVEQLLIEARLLDENPDKDHNPAFPTNEAVADEAIERIEQEGLEPAWYRGPWQGNTHE